MRDGSTSRLHTTATGAERRCSSEAAKSHTSFLPSKIFAATRVYHPITPCYVRPALSIPCACSSSVHAASHQPCSGHSQGAASGREGAQMAPAACKSSSRMVSSSTEHTMYPAAMELGQSRRAAASRAPGLPAGLPACLPACHSSTSTQQATRMHPRLRSWETLLRTRYPSQLAPPWRLLTAALAWGC
jgi:hypothetical protein